MTDLAEEIGLYTLVRNDRPIIYLYEESLPVPMGTMLGVPMEFKALLSTELISWPGKLKASLEYFKDTMPLYKDISVGEFFRHRFGNEVLENMIEPLLSGVYGTNIDQLSLMSTYPNFKKTEQYYGSLMKGLPIEISLKPQAPKKKVGQFYQFSDGLQSFIDRLVEVNIEKGGQINFQADVIDIEKLDDGYRVTVNGESQVYDEVIVTTPHFQYKSLV